LHQIKEEEKIKDAFLGVGRCGMVRKIQWKNGYAAVKDFQKGDDMTKKTKLNPLMHTSMN